MFVVLFVIEYAGARILPAVFQNTTVAACPYRGSILAIVSPPGLTTFLMSLRLGPKGGTPLLPVQTLSY